MFVAGLISLVIGLMSLVYSIATNKQTHKEQQIINEQQQISKEILGKIEAAIKDWHDKIMQSTIKLIESQPAIIAAQSQLEDSKIKYEAVISLLDRIKHIAENPLPEKDAKPQIAALNLLLEALPKILRSLPEEAYSKIVERLERQGKKHPEQNQSSPNQSKKD